MINQIPKPYYLLISVLMFCFGRVQAQSILNKQLNFSADRKPLADVLLDLGKRGNFSISYNARLLPQDSLVSINVANQTVAIILSTLLKDRYAIREYQNYLIITEKLPGLVFLDTDITNDNSNNYSISGLVVNDRSGERLMNASVYVKEQLVSVLTDEHGYFRIKFRADNPSQISLTASKLSYRDTTINFLQTVSVSSRFNPGVYDNTVTRNNRVERTGMGRLFISARQRIQTLNIPDFFAKRPFQVSLTPGLSSHGMFSPQVVNRFSLNIAGGYTAGVNGFEFGGLFNINKMDAKYVQLATVFNLVGGKVTGIQVAGVHNRAIDTVRGIQAAGFINKAESTVVGLQIASLNNNAHKLKGLQIGLVNTVDTSSGASIGLVNIIGNGFYKVSLTTNDVTNTNISLKTGTHNFYSTLLTGTNISSGSKLHSFGLGIGHDFMLSNSFYVSTEVAYQAAYTGLWDDRWFQAKMLFNVQVSKHISLLAGPVFNSYNHSGSFHQEGYKNVTHIPDYPGQAIDGHQTRNWIGWEAGLAFNSVFKPVKKTVDNSRAWYLGGALTAGLGWDDPYSKVYGAEVFVQRDLGEHISGIITTGYTYFPVDKGYPPIYGDGTINIYDETRSMMPLKVGVRLKTGSAFYISGDVGVAFGLFKEPVFYFSNLSSSPVYKPYRSTMISAGAGFSFQSGIETGFKFEDYGYYYKQFALRLGYRLKLSK
ncbi:carboxypeptidase-like regulatory domain-containing protein [Mucilaginibacter sp. SMC90]|uniref:carboxypeptidase-like regulatory domain-containing protein n=1 Tax=Mucilaginibacter sp. SMC90 TaxID=2929803 RepID=UPI001FB366E9|nr:carboxypeptidase-like regulatory domain-containing protein [Mucilaginibacter sp. SMC90]UOE49418.1 carboxypeptidase-like regulatory domain-containing protein [Mucilaginibacter sp. SMC90]